MSQAWSMWYCSHPKYSPRRRPRANCPNCWRKYLTMRADKDICVLTVADLLNILMAVWSWDWNNPEDGR